MCALYTKDPLREWWMLGPTLFTNGIGNPESSPCVKLRFLLLPKEYIFLRPHLCRDN